MAVLPAGQRVLAGERATASHVEVLYLADVERISVARQQSSWWNNPPVPEVTFTGHADQAAAELLTSTVPERGR